MKRIINTCFDAHEKLLKETGYIGTGTNSREASGDPGQQHQPEAQKATAKVKEKVMVRARKATVNGITHRAAERKATKRGARIIPRRETGGRAHHQTRRRMFASSKCKNGDSCSKAHHPPCRFERMPGGCKKGKNCLFPHQQPATPATGNEKNKNNDGKPPPRGRSPERRPQGQGGQACIVRLAGITMVICRKMLPLVLKQ